ncbi:MAG: 2-oxoacid:acceptor oxidoreductase family protein [Lutispora sp.]|nr:2-oxoacid:acceptor oxidoreductase family protein [Lutispora sp.]MDD4834395.1 2-oxoacid:acceptor oxidoreductase family protein [Lutispora sp.]
MKNKHQIVLSGVGGQGLIACGGILAEAAIVHENMYATMSSSYGVETRGTFTKSDIIISNKEIYYTEVMKEDIVLSLAQVAYDRYVSKVDSDACLVYDNSLVKEVKESKAKQYGFPFTNLARELGNTTAANIIALGTIIKLTGILSEESVLNAIQDAYKEKPKVSELNIKAFKKGLEIAQK